MSNIRITATSDGKFELRIPGNTNNLEKVILSKSRNDQYINDVDINNNNPDSDFFNRELLFKKTLSMIPPQELFPYKQPILPPTLNDIDGDNMNFTITRKELAQLLANKNNKGEREIERDNEVKNKRKNKGGKGKNKDNKDRKKKK